MSLTLIDKLLVLNQMFDIHWWGSLLRRKANVLQIFFNGLTMSVMSRYALWKPFNIFACLQFQEQESLTLARLGMLADGAYECLSLVRFFDTEGFDVAEVPAQIEALLGRLSFLFLQQRGCLSCTSFTSAAASVCFFWHGSNSHLNIKKTLDIHLFLTLSASTILFSWGCNWQLEETTASLPRREALQTAWRTWDSCCPPGQVLHQDGSLGQIAGEINPGWVPILGVALHSTSYSQVWA